MNTSGYGNLNLLLKRFFYDTVFADKKDLEKEIENYRYTTI